MKYLQFRFPNFIFTLLLSSILFSCTETKKKDETKEADFLLKKGLSNYEKQQFDSTFYYFNKAKLLYNPKEKEKIVYALFFMADVQLIQCDFAGSEENATEALKTFPEYKNISTIYNLLELIYLEQFDYKNALKYNNLCLNLSKTESEKCVLKNNSAHVFMEAKNFIKAKTVLENVLQNDSVKNDKANYARILDNLGFTYFKLNNPKAISLLNQSLQIRDSLKLDYDSTSSLIHLSEYYQNSNSDLANSFADKAYKIATINKVPNDRILALKFLISTSNSNQSKKLAQIQFKISDSINRVRQIAKNEFSKIKYDSKKATTEAVKYKNQNSLLFVLVGLLILIGILLYFLYKSRNKRKLQKIVYQTETRISKKLHDELANDVFNAMTFAENQDLNSDENKEYLLDTLDTIYARTRNIAKENSDIETGTKFQENLMAMISSYISNDVNVIVQDSNAINWQNVKKEVKISLFRIVQELLVNMKKHSQCTIVIIGFKTQKSTVEITYKDNGIGTSEMLKFKSGLQNAENRILVVKGTITFETESNKGFKATLIAPK
ncbi:hypothetical protein [Flavobacterium sp.]|uniref:hypothetical protein n=1 Tax=Flavobacterium sp. TaxID=239 RepID=UPI0037513B32